MEDEFWLWVSSWALFITKPSDINPDYSDDGYVLPPLDVRWHEIPIHYGDSVDRDGQMELFTQASTGLKEAAKIKRESIDARVEKMKEIVDSSPEEHFILWHDQEAERHAIKKVLPETVDIYGSMDYDLREQRVIDFPMARQGYLPPRSQSVVQDVTSSGFVTGRYLLVLIMSSMTSYRLCTGVTGSCSRTQ